MRYKHTVDSTVDYDVAQNSEWQQGRLGSKKFDLITYPSTTSTSLAAYSCSLVNVSK